MLIEKRSARCKPITVSGVGSEKCFAASGFDSLTVPAVTPNEEVGQQVNSKLIKG